MTIKQVNISTIVNGDTIICRDGIIRTVGRNNIKRDSFMGVTLFGDSYNLGTILVDKILKLN